MIEQQLFSFLVGLFFACFGSFSTMLIYRLHHDVPIIKKHRSMCPECKNPLAAYDLIPILSWVVLRGKCRKCGKPISPIYPLMEVSFVIMGAWFAYSFYQTNQLWPMLILLFFILCLFWYDVLYFEVDRRISFPAISLVLLWIFVGAFIGWDRALGWESYVIGGGIGMFFYAFQYFVSRGTWVGFGDLEFGLFLGLLLGWQHLLLALFLAYIIGTVVAIPLMIWGKAGRKTPLPMGAFLMPALIAMLLYGDIIEHFYWSFVFPV